MPLARATTPSDFAMKAASPVSRASVRNAATSSSSISATAGTYLVSFSDIGFFPSFGQSFCPGDIAGLAGLVAPAQKHDVRVAAPQEIDPIARAVMNPDFADA